MKISFIKYQGAGNDFILIDNRKLSLPDLALTTIRLLCDRQLGIGADGVLIVEKSLVTDYKMRIFNADGSTPSMCGNGLRCAFDYLAKEQDFCTCEMEVAGRILSCKRVGDKTRVGLGPPVVLHWPIQLDSVAVYVLDTGVPHALIFVRDIVSAPLLELSPKIRFHPLFSPGGVNVNFVQVNSDGSLHLRTYERGVEKETLSCGTGAAAAAWAAAQLHHLSGTVTVQTRCSFQDFTFQESLCFDLSDKQIEMLGDARPVFTGQIDLKCSAML